MKVLANFRLLLKNLYVDSTASDEAIISAYYETFRPILPFVFDGTNFHPCVGSERKFKIFLIFLFNLQTLKLFITSIQLYLVDNFHHTYIIVALMSLSITTTSFFITAIFNAHQYCQTLNSWLALKKGKRTGFTDIVKPLFITVFIFGLSLCLLFHRFPDKPYFFFSISGLGKNAHRLVIGIFMILEVMIQAYTFVGNNLLVDGFLIGMFQTLFENLEQLKQVNSIGPLELLQYRTLQTFEVFLNKGTGLIFTVIKLASYLCITYSAVKAVMSAGDPELLSELITAISMLIPISFRVTGCLIEVARFNTKSLELLETWKMIIRLQSKDRRHNIKALESFKPLEYSINSMYTMQGHSVLTFFSSLVSNIASVLIAYTEQ